MSQKNEQKKSVTITLNLTLAKRLSFIRRVPLKQTSVSDMIESSIDGICEALERKIGITPETWKVARDCPSCKSGLLIPKSKKGENKPAFMGCTHFPECRHTENLSNTVKNEK